PCPRAPRSTVGSVRPHPGLWSFVPPRQHVTASHRVDSRPVPHSPRITSRAGVVHRYGFEPADHTDCAHTKTAMQLCARVSAKYFEPVSEISRMAEYHRKLLVGYYV